jgi:hypothetical protein
MIDSIRIEQNFPINLKLGNLSVKQEIQFMPVNQQKPPPRTLKV